MELGSLTGIGKSKWQRQSGNKKLDRFGLFWNSLMAHAVIKASTNFLLYFQVCVVVSHSFCNLLYTSHSYWGLIFKQFVFNSLF